MWKYDFKDNEQFDEEFCTIHEKINEIKFVIECEDKCDKCNNDFRDNRCNDCDKCNCGLRIGQALEFYELLVTVIKKHEKKYLEQDNHISYSFDEYLENI